MCSLVRRTVRFSLLVVLIAVVPGSHLAQDSILTPTEGIQVGDRMPGASSIAFADFNQDGNQDLVVGNDLGVSILAGRGASRFELSRTVRLDCSVISVVTADFNLDAIPDIAALCSGSGTVSVLLGRGDGEFRVSAVLPVNSYNVRGLLASDLNQDGIPDLAAGQYDGVALFAGVGDGSFRAMAELKAGQSVYAFIAADFNGDSIPDLAVGAGVTMQVWLQSSPGRYETAKEPAANVGCAIYDMAAADFNGDGRLDLAVACGNGIQLLLASGYAAFEKGIKISDSAAPLSIATGDLNGDRIPDITYGNGDTGRIGLLMGKSDGTFERADAFAAVGEVVAAVAIADVNGDSRPDIMAAGWESGSVLVASGRGDGKFDSPLYFGLPGQSLFSVDFDHNGKADLLVVGSFRKELRLLRRASAYVATIDLPSYPIEVKVGDFNGDGSEDILLSSLDSLFVTAASPDAGLSIFLLAGTQAGFLAPRKVASMPYKMTSSSSAPRLVTGEFTGDKALDFAVANNTIGKLQVFRGSGTGEFEVAESADVVAVALAVADFDGDGIDDIAVVPPVSYGSAPGGSVYLAGPTGFKNVKPFMACSGVAQLLTANLMAPKSRDLVAFCNSEISILLNSGGGTFRPVSPLKAHADSAAIGDFDKDGKDDLLLAISLNDFWGVGKILASNGDGTFRSYGGVALPPATSSLSVQHWDDDGVPDVAAFSAREFTVSIGRLQEVQR